MSLKIISMNIKKMYKKISNWEPRLVFCCLSIAVAFLLIGHLIYLGVAETSGGLEEFKKLNRSMTDIRELEENFFGIQKNMQFYIYAGQKSLGETIDWQIEQMITAVERLSHEVVFIHSPIISDLGNRLQKYRQEFSSAVDLREQRRQLVGSDVIHSKKKIKKILSKEAYRYNSSEIENLMHKFDTSLYKYLLSHYAEDIKGMVSKLTLLIQSIDDDLDKELKTNLIEYKNLIEKVIDFNGRYLNLMRIAIAGEEDKIIADIEKLAKHQSQSLFGFINRFESSLVEGKHNLFITLFILAIFSLCVVIFVMYSIIKPMELFTSAVHKMALGDLNYQVPFVDRSDKIGLLAKSLDQIRNKQLSTLNSIDTQKKDYSVLKEHHAELQHVYDEVNQFFEQVSKALREPALTSQNLINFAHELVAIGEFELVFKSIPKIKDANQRVVDLIDRISGYADVTNQEWEMVLLDVHEILDCVIMSIKDELNKNNVVLNVQSIPAIYGNKKFIYLLFESLLKCIVYEKMATSNGKTIDIGSMRKTSDTVILFIKYQCHDIEKISHQQWEEVDVTSHQVAFANNHLSLSLVLAQKIMKNHSGQFWLEGNQMDSGTTYWLSFPNSV